MWKSLLFVPVLEDRFVKSAPSRGASAVVLDLEASIAPDRKVEARNALAHAVKQLSPDVDVTVRINPLWLDAIRDLEASVIAGVSALHLARCTSAGDVAAIDNVVGELEVERGLAKGSIRLIAMLESPGAVLSAEEIAAASPRMVGLTLGVEDYATEMGTKTSEDLLRRAGFDVIQAAHAAHISPLVVPASMADFRDLDALETAARYARSLGSSGGYAVHPAQVKVLNEVFAPTAEELDWADRVLAASEDAATSGKAVFQVAGQMIDRPLINRAKRIAANR